MFEIVRQPLMIVRIFQKKKNPVIIWPLPPPYRLDPPTVISCSFAFVLFPFLSLTVLLASFF
ncbi:hypothetical protein, partial [Klebsiella pneumoniae]|uniref:hypothetical protein n=1 Tax=Klebsiella pneumoniae TaxID=573 RepID=UPI0006C157DF